MATKDISMEEINDLGNLFRKSRFEFLVLDGKIKIIINNANSLDDAENKISNTLNYINNYANYTFSISIGSVKKISEQKYEIELILVKK